MIASLLPDGHQHKALVQRLIKIDFDNRYEGRVDRLLAVLAEVLRTLETVTPEMVAGYWGGFDNCKPEATAKRLATNAWTDMLRASPLTPPVEPVQQP